MHLCALLVCESCHVSICMLVCVGMGACMHVCCYGCMCSEFVMTREGT